MIVLVVRVVTSTICSAAKTGSASSAKVKVSVVFFICFSKLSVKSANAAACTAGARRHIRQPHVRQRPHVNITESSRAANVAVIHGLLAGGQQRARKIVINYSASTKNDGLNL